MPHDTSATRRPPRYLRVVVTRACPLACAYCHAEGDPGQDIAGPTVSERADLVLAGIANGVRKVKLLGGEPLVARGAADLVALVKSRAPGCDLSAITSGAAPLARLDALFDAGLDRANLSIHGWGVEAFALRGGTARTHAMRATILASLLARGRPLKLNFVLGGDADLPDLAALLEWAAGKPLVVNILDDLGKPGIGPGGVLAAARSLRGPELHIERCDDADSLDTLRLHWADGLEVEVKHHRLGEIAPWRACATCPARARCGEGIHAVRLSFDGKLRACMDRPDLEVPLLPVLRAGGIAAATEAWAAWTRERTACA